MSEDKNKETINAPAIVVHEEIFEIISQEHKANGMVQIKYKAKSGRKALVLLRPEGTYDEYIYEVNDELISYKNKKIKCLNL